MSLAERLWARVDKQDDGHWIWQGAVEAHGYGVIGRGRRGEGNILTHRAAWELLRGPIPAETPHIDHLCRVRLCCNPDHLEPVTQAENNRRQWAHLRRPDCPQGHTFTPENTYRNPASGARQCRACLRANARRQAAKAKAS